MTAAPATRRARTPVASMLLGGLLLGAWLRESR